MCGNLWYYRDVCFMVIKSAVEPCKSMVELVLCFLFDDFSLMHNIIHMHP